jgi:hypothetical protein
VAPSPNQHDGNGNGGGSIESRGSRSGEGRLWEVPGLEPPVGVALGGLGQIERGPSLLVVLPCFAHAWSELEDTLQSVLRELEALDVRLHPTFLFILDGTAETSESVRSRLGRLYDLGAEDQSGDRARVCERLPVELAVEAEAEAGLGRGPGQKTPQLSRQTLRTAHSFVVQKGRARGLHSSITWATWLARVLRPDLLLLMEANAVMGPSCLRRLYGCLQRDQRAVASGARTMVKSPYQAHMPAFAWWLSFLPPTQGFELEVSVQAPSVLRMRGGEYAYTR